MFSKDTFEFSNTFSSGHQPPNLAQDLQLPQPQFPLIPTPISNPPIHVPPMQFTMPELGASSGFNHQIPSVPPPVLFSYPTTLNHPPETIPVKEIVLDTSVQATKNVLPKASLHIQSFSNALTVYEATKKATDNITQDIKAGVHAEQAVLCDALAVLAESSTDYFLKAVVVDATVGGLAASATAFTGGVMTGNPPLAVSGAGGALFFASMAVPAYIAAGDIARNGGQIVQALCDDAFESARQYSQRK